MFGAITPTKAPSVNDADELMVTELTPVTFAPNVTVVAGAVDADKVTS